MSYVQLRKQVDCCLIATVVVVQYSKTSTNDISKAPTGYEPRSRGRALSLLFIVVGYR